MTVLLAMLSSAVFGCGVVLQQRMAWDVPQEHAARPSILLRLVRRPLWLLGMAADVIGFGLQAAALRHGSLLVVQPLLTTFLLFALFLTATWSKEPVSGRQWGAVVLVLVGLAGFLADTAPDQTSVGSADGRGWALTIGAIAIAAGLVVGAGLRAQGTWRAALFGVGAGMADAMMATLGKAFAESLNHGVLHVFTTWTPYAVVGGGLASLVLIQTAYQAGHPTVSLPVITVTDPVVAGLIGIFLFGERLQLGGVRGPLLPFAILAMAVGLTSLSRDDRLAAEVSGTANRPLVQGESMK
jgi:drug/metabolite transporter (DMT)-like permease